MVFYKRETPAANATPRTAQRRASTANEAIERGSNAGRAERWKALKPWSWDGSGRGEERQNGQGVLFFLFFLLPSLRLLLLLLLLLFHCWWWWW